MSPEQQSDVRAAVRIAILEAMSPWRTINSAGEYLGVSRSYITKLRRDGRLTGHTDGSILRFKTSDLDALLKPEIK